MKNFLKNLALMAVAAVGAVACTEADVEDVVVVPDYGTTLYASVAETPETKVGFEDNGTEGIALTWEVGDEFTLYSGDDKVGTFTCEDAESGVFKGSATLTEGTEYTAKYNEDATLEEQDGDEINNLDAACKMSATFIYGSDETITFEHEMAIMTFEFESEETPSKLIFENGEETYTILYSDIEPVEGLYTSHIMINPCEAETRTLIFTLYDSEDIAYDIRTVSTSKAYEAGYRYTATVSDVEICTWSGEGSGTESDPYLVSTADLLRELSTNVNSGISYDGRYFLMTKDIDLGGIDADGEGIAENEFTAIGYYTSSTKYSYFKGTFDGDGHVISGLYINQASNYQGLFSRVYGATIKNLGVSGSVSGKQYVGGVAGYAQVLSTITNCYNMCDVSSSSTYMGGVVGYANATTLTECYNKGVVTGGSNYVGGVAGYASASTVTACHNEGDVSGSGNRVGGVIGYAYCSVMACYNVGKVWSDDDYVGGVVGYANTSSPVIACYNAGSIVGEDSVGGVVGYAASDVTACFNIGAVAGNSSVNSTVGSLSSSSTTVSCYFITGASSYGTRVSLSGLNSAVTEMNSAAEVEYFTVNSGNIIPSLFDEQIEYNGLEVLESMAISSVSDLKEFAELVSGGYGPFNATLTADLDLGDEPWTPIGTPDIPCCTNFDGGEHTISGLYIDSSEESYKGLFGYVKGASIKNITIKEPNITCYGYSGAVCGYIYTGAISNCSVEGGSITGGYYCIGGVVGRANSAPITECSNTSTLSATYYMGGIVGTADESPVTSCYSSGNVSGTKNGIGGIAGYAQSTSPVTECYNTGDITGGGTYVGGVVGYAQSYSPLTECYNTGDISGNGYTGGVVGYAITYSPLTICYNIGDVSSSGTYSGGVVGYASTYSSVTECYNSGSVSASGKNYIGGVAGRIYSYSNMTACYNSGDVSGSSYNGGVVGHIYSNSIVTSCYSCGGVSGSGYVGGVIGYIYSSGSAISSYYDTTIYSDGVAINTNKGTESDVEGKTTDEMTDAGFVAILNDATDDDYWMADSGINSGYPILTWQK